MIRRHPHVFADGSGRLTPSDVKGAWDRIKAEEKAERAARRPEDDAPHNSLLSGVKAGQPALTRAMELQRKASSVGFDWNDPRAVLHKIREEADEIEAALDRGDAEELAGETGDLLFALVNLARHVGADPEMALRGTNAKFERRFAYIERALAAQGRSLEGASLEEMDALWNEAKKKESCQRTNNPSARQIQHALHAVPMHRGLSLREAWCIACKPPFRASVIAARKFLRVNGRFSEPPSKRKEGGGTPKGAPW